MVNTALIEKTVVGFAYKLNEHKILASTCKFDIFRIVEQRRI